MSAARGRGLAQKRIRQQARPPARTRAKARTKTRATPATPLESARRYETVALVLQGGGALGAYQCGVYEALHGAGIRPGWFAGTSIGAINAAILAGNAPTQRVARLREFWKTIAEPAGTIVWPNATAVRDLLAWLPPNSVLSAWIGTLSAIGALAQGQRGFFTPRALSPFAQAPGTAAATSFYDTAPLRATLERLVDFDRINAGDVRLTIGATNVRNGNFRYFDSANERIGPEHVMASGALPPAFPAIEIEGETYWDGGLVSNTPLEYVLESTPRRDTLALQVDLWSARGVIPRTLLDVLERQKDIQYSSRTRMGTDAAAARQKLRNTLALLLETIPARHLPARVVADLEPWLCDRVFNVIHLIYQAKPYEEQFKDYAFGRIAMREHWHQGFEDMTHSLSHPEFFVPPPREIGVATHDIHRRIAPAPIET
jgi:NTE family protein